MFLKRIESSEMMSSQMVGANLQPGYGAFGSSFKAWVERFVLQTAPHGYSDDQIKVLKYRFVFCNVGANCVK